MMGVVYHANYLLYFEDARTQFLQAIGFPYDHIEQAGYMSPVTHFECDYGMPLRYGDTAIVRTRVVSSRPTKTVYAYEVFKEGQDLDADKPCCTGRSTHCLVDAETGQLEARRARSVRALPRSARTRGRGGPMSAPYRILFVCHGNICRSTMAEFVMKDLVARRGMADAFDIASARLAVPRTAARAPFSRRRASIAAARRRAACDATMLSSGISSWAWTRPTCATCAASWDAGPTASSVNCSSSPTSTATWPTGDFDATYDDVLAGCTGLLAWLTAGAARS